MMHCDVCSQETTLEKGTFYTDEEFRMLVAQGFEPPLYFFLLREALRLSRKPRAFPWMHLKRLPQSDWLFCSYCARRAAKVMPKSGDIGLRSEHVSECSYEKGTIAVFMAIDATSRRWDRGKVAQALAQTVEIVRRRRIIAEAEGTILKAKDIVSDVTQEEVWIGKCDVCDTTTIWGECTIFTAREFQALVDQGFQLDETNPAVHLATRFGVSPAEFHKGIWKSLIAESTTDWTLCPSCMSKAVVYTQQSQKKWWQFWK